MKFRWNQQIGRFVPHKFMRDVLGLAVGRGLNLVIGAISMLVYGAVFSKPEIAVISLIEMVVGLIMSFGVSWSEVGVTRFGKEELRVTQSLNYTSSTRLCLVLPVLVIASIATVLFQDVILGYIGGTEPALIWYLLGGLCLTATNDHVTSLFTTREMHHANAIFYVAQSAGQLSVVAAFLFGLVEPSVLRFVSAIVWLNALGLLLRLPFCGKPFFFPLVRVRQVDVRKFFRYAAPQLYGFAGIFVINWIDVYFIRKHGTLDGLGAYQFLYGVFLKMCALAMLANALLFPRIMAWKRSHPKAIARYTLHAPPIVFVAVSIACGMLVLIFPHLLRLCFGNKFEIAYSSFTLMICATPFCFLTYLFVPVLNSFDRVSTIQWVNLISAGSNIILDYALVPRYGLVGAAFATFVAYALVANLLMFATHQLFTVRLPILSALSLGLMAFAVSYFLLSVAV